MASEDPFAFQDDELPHTPDVERPAATENDPELVDRVLEAVKTVRDPEIPVNIVDLGLIYELIANKDGIVYIEMTLTAPACPVAGEMPGQIRDVVAEVEGVNDVRVKLVWSPPWEKDRMSEEAKLELGLM